MIKSIIFGLLLASLVCSAIPGRWGRNFPTVTPIPLDFELEALLLDLSSFPPGWQASDKLRDDEEDQGEVEEHYIEFTTETFKSPTMHIVFLYQNEEDAERSYSRYLPAYFSSGDRITPWNPPPGVNYQSQV